MSSRGIETQLTKISFYDKHEIRSLIQKMLRDPALLSDDEEVRWKMFHYFAEEYLDTLKKNPASLLLFVAEDCVRCHPNVLEDVIRGIEKPEKMTRRFWHRLLKTIADQPLDRSVAYLSVACLEDLLPLPTASDAGRRPWRDAVISRKRNQFADCVDHLIRETDAVPATFPMTMETVSRLARAISHLDHWQSKNKKAYLTPETAHQTFSKIADNEAMLEFTDNASEAVWRARRIRTSLIAVAAVPRWMAREESGGGGTSIPPVVRRTVSLHLKAALLCTRKRDGTRFHLSAMAMLLLLSDRPFPPLKKKRPEMDLTIVPTFPRAFPMPAFAIDKHTRRGGFRIDTSKTLTKLCLKGDSPIPARPEYSHGPSPHLTKQGFAEFAAQIAICEERNGDGTEPVFKLEAMALYEEMKKENKKKRHCIMKKMMLDGEKKRKRESESESEEEEEEKEKEGPPAKRSKREEGKEKEARTKSRIPRKVVDWVVKRSASVSNKSKAAFLWSSLKLPMAQLPAGGRKPSVRIDDINGRALKGPFSDFKKALTQACSTQLAREVFGLRECIPEVLPIVAEDGRMGLVSPLVGRSSSVAGGEEKGEGKTFSYNEDRGLTKLHNFIANGQFHSLTNPLELLKLVVAKSLVGSSDNNTSNLLVEEQSGRVYGLDIGGKSNVSALSRAAHRKDSRSLEWAFSKPPGEDVMSKIDDLAKAHAREMTDWLNGCKSAKPRRKYDEICATYAFICPTIVSVDDYVPTLDAFLVYFQRLLP